MNLDYIEVAKFLNKDSLNFHYLDKEASFKGADKYFFKGCRKLEVWHYSNTNLLKIKGSLPYFINGHNFFSSLEDWAEGLDYLSSCLNTNVYSGLVECFEFGTIQEIPFSEELFLRNHIKLPGTGYREYKKGEILTGKEFINSSLKVKIYDASRNIKNKLDKPIQDEISRLYGWDRTRHYIKIENHYKKPKAYFRGNVYLNELLASSFKKQLQEHLISTYQSIMKTGKLTLPEKKADLNAGTLPLLILKELEGIYPFKTEDLLKAKIKAISDKILSPDDKKARMKILRENLKKITNQGKSEYDISELLQAKIKQEIESG
ncbi:MAG TPA: hypothetical protein DCR40_15750 [Prolixibacteraceae bacterium]|nr:hypothetical protein [Prolixibacteraceae bacterium]